MQSFEHTYRDGKGRTLALLCAVVLVVSSLLVALFPMAAFADEIKTSSTLGIKVVDTSAENDISQDKTSQADGTMKVTSTLGLRVVDSSKTDPDDPFTQEKKEQPDGSLTVTSTLGIRVVNSENYVKMHEVKWMAEDGTLLGTTEHAYGTMPAPTDAIVSAAQKAPDSQYTYILVWEPQIEVVTGLGNQTYRATYDCVLNTYTITWDADNGSAPSEEELEYGTSITAPVPNPTKASVTTDAGTTTYEFQYWKDESGNRVNFTNLTVTGDATYTAVYEETFTPAAPDTYVVAFDTQGGTAVSAQTVENGSNATRPAANPTREGYTFAGWYAEAACMTEFNFSSAITADTTVYAKWETIIYTIAYAAYADGTSAHAESVNVASTDTVTLPAADDEGLTKVKGHKLAGWYAFAGELPKAAQTDMAVTGAPSNATAYAGGASATALELAKAAGAKVSDAVGTGTTITLYATWTPVYSVTVTLADIANRTFTLQNGTSAAIAVDPFKFTSATPRVVDIYATSTLDSSFPLKRVLGVDALTSAYQFGFAKSATLSGGNLVTTDELCFPVDGSDRTKIGATSAATADADGKLEGILTLRVGSPLLITQEANENWGRLSRITWTADINSDGQGTDTGSWLYANAEATTMA